ncbi:MAG: RNA 2'-phosphotransferase [Myxococcota bacterium]
MGYDRRAISKTMAHALRHAPHLYELDLDEDGWADASELLAALREHRARWRALTLEDLADVVASSPKQRFEMDGARVRARYGHSLAERLKRVPGAPPELLYHGTPSSVVDAILADGIRPMSRQFVHMSVDAPGALEVGRRKGGAPVLLVIRAREAYDAGHAFYEGNEFVWLADFVPAEFIDRS